MTTASTTSTRGTTLAIAVLLPDVLGTYSDAGNAIVLAERARRRHIPTHVQHVAITDIPPRTADIYLLGGGEDTAQLAAAQWLHTHRLRDELAHRRLVLAVCAGFQLLGTTMTDRAGHTYGGAEVIDAATAPGPRRAVGEILTTSALPDVGRLTGFENHLGRTRLGPGHIPLGHVERGVGNGLPHEHFVDGVVTPTVIGTYLSARAGPGPQPSARRPPPHPRRRPTPHPARPSRPRRRPPHLPDHTTATQIRTSPPVSRLRLRIDQSSERELGIGAAKKHHPDKPS